MNQPTVLNIARQIAAVILLSLCFAPAASADAGRQAEGRVLVFWATWCGFCKETLKTVDDMQSDNQLSGYKAVAVNLPNDSKNPQAFLQNMGIKLPSAELAKLRDAASGVIGVPWVVMVDADGQVIAGQRAPRSKEQLSAWVGSMDQVHQQLSLLQ